jgi:hypothetical protein
MLFTKPGFASQREDNDKYLLQLSDQICIFAAKKIALYPLEKARHGRNKNVKNKFQQNGFFEKRFQF